MSLSAETLGDLDLLRAEIAHSEIPQRTTYGFVPTPDHIAEMIVEGHAGFSELGTYREASSVLDPSGGNGALILAMLDHNPDVHVTTIEPHPERVAVLERIAAITGRVTVHAGTFEEFYATNPQARFEAVIMNPPFSVPGYKDLWMRHVKMAHALTLPGGRVTAIVPGSYGNQGRKFAEFHAWAEEQRAYFEELPAGTFTLKAGVLTVPVPIVRADGRPSWVFGPRTEGVPVRVLSPRTAPRDVAAMPVQVYRDDLGNENRVVRFAGTCAHCGRLIWMHDNGAQDAQMWSGCKVFDAREDGLEGPDIGCCLPCGTDGPTTDKIRVIAGEFWTVPGEPAGSFTYPMDLIGGNWAVVTGHDWRGPEWTVTMCGQLQADPRYSGGDDDSIIVKLRTALGAVHELYVRADSRVTVTGGPVKVTQPEPVSEPVSEPVTAPVVRPVRDVWGPVIRAMKAKTQP